MKFIAFGKSLSVSMTMALITVLLMGCPELPEGVILVNRDSPLGNVKGGLEDGLTWTTAFNTLQEGIDAAEALGDGTEVWVVGGLYNESRVDIDGSIVLKEGVHIYGGFAGTEFSRDARDPETNVTIIDGSESLITKARSAATHVVKGADNATLDGFTITGGYALFGGDTYDTLGAGMLNVGVSPTVIDCLFISNIASTGGGVYNENAAPTFENCTFDTNIGVGIAGGIMEFQSDSQITSCLFTNNQGVGTGGGIFIDTSTTTIDKCIFEYNDGVGTGGGAFITGSTTATITNSLFQYNYANGAGAGILDGGNTVVANCVFFGNVAPGVGGGVLVGGADGLGSYTNCIFWGNEASADPDIQVGDATPVTFSCVEGGFGGTGNTGGDPLFVDPLNGDFRLGVGSSALNTGTAAGAPVDDFDGTSRPQGGVVDMGIYEQ